MNANIAKDTNLYDHLNGTVTRQKMLPMDIYSDLCTVRLDLIMPSEACNSSAKNANIGRVG